MLIIVMSFFVMIDFYAFLSFFDNCCHIYLLSALLIALQEEVK